MLAIGVFGIKPQLCIGVLAFVIGWKNRRAVIGGVTGGGIVVVGSLVLVGFHGFAMWLGLTKDLLVHRGQGEYLGIPGLLTTILGSHSVTYVMTGVAVGFLGLGAGWVGLQVRNGRVNPAVGVSVAVIISLCASPHLYLHDFVVFAPIFVFLTVKARNEGILIPGALWWLVLGISAFIDMRVTQIGNLIKLSPLILLVSVFLLWHERNRWVKVAS